MTLQLAQGAEVHQVAVLGSLNIFSKQVHRVQ